MSTFTTIIIEIITIIIAVVIVIIMIIIIIIIGIYFWCDVIPIVNFKSALTSTALLLLLICLLFLLLLLLLSSSLLLLLLLEYISRPMLFQPLISKALLPPAAVQSCRGSRCQCRKASWPVCRTTPRRTRSRQRDRPWTSSRSGSSLRGRGRLQWRWSLWSASHWWLYPTCKQILLESGWNPTILLV